MSDPTAVYLTRAGENEELRYSLRSLVNLPHDDVLLVGLAPAWYSGPLLRSDQAGDKGRVTTRSMRVVVESRLTTDPFLYFNDDFYILEPGPQVEAYHRGPIDELVARYAEAGFTPDNSRWIRGMIQTSELLKSHGIREPLSYELHVPMLVDKLTMAAALNLGGQKRTVYGNLAGVDGPCIDDVKIDRRPDLVASPFRFLSSSDDTFELVRPLLEERFPDPSPFEG